MSLTLIWQPNVTSVFNNLLIVINLKYIWLSNQTNLDLLLCFFSAHDSDIKHVAAVIHGKTFNRYIVRKKRIEAHAKVDTGLSVKNGMLFHQGKPVQTVPLNVAVEDFTSFRGKLNYPVIIGHNIANFDVPVLYL